MRKVLAGALAAMIGHAAVQAAPLPWQEVTYSSVEQAGTVRLRQFDPAKGALISARAETFGLATFALNTAKPITTPTPYNFKVGYYIYYGPASFHLFLDGGETLAAYQPGYSLTAKGKGAETVTGKGLAILKGKDSLTLSFSPDLPQPAPPGVPPGTFQMTKGGGSVSITYRYYPSLRFRPRPVPKQIPYPNPVQPQLRDPRASR